jgi:hypothetical protein
MPDEEFNPGGNLPVKDGEETGRYEREATEFDRYFCPDFHRCGGVLVPQLRKEHRRRQDH